MWYGVVSVVVANKTHYILNNLIPPTHTTTPDTPDGYRMEDFGDGDIDYLSPKNFHIIHPKEFNSVYDTYIEEEYKTKAYSGTHSAYKSHFVLKWVRVKVWVPKSWVY